MPEAKLSIGACTNGWPGFLMINFQLPTFLALSQSGPNALFFSVITLIGVVHCSLLGGTPQNRAYGGLRQPVQSDRLFAERPGH
jgi:hypothetical protein